jgi:hypothetical protein
MSNSVLKCTKTHLQESVIPKKCLGSLALAIRGGQDGREARNLRPGLGEEGGVGKARDRHKGREGSPYPKNCCARLCLKHIVFFESSHCRRPIDCIYLTTTEVGLRAISDITELDDCM